MSRYVAVKEEHAEKAEREIRVIWGDFIKPEHAEKYPELNALVHKIMKLGSKSRQTANRATPRLLSRPSISLPKSFGQSRASRPKRPRPLTPRRWNWFIPIFNAQTAQDCRPKPGT